MSSSGRPSFYRFAIWPTNRFEIYTTIVLLIISCAALQWIYPFPNTYSDTGAYITVARTGLIGNFRPPGFSWFMALSHAIHPNPDVLVVLQTVLYFFSTFFFYLTIKLFFYNDRQLVWRLFFLVFMLSPTVIYLCNFVISDSVFISLTNLWIASLLWMLAVKSPKAVIWNTILLVLLIQVRYIALFYPLITVITLFVAFFKKEKLRFVLYSLLQVIVFGAIVLITINQTKKNIGVPVLSGFSGWQKANNAMHILPYINLKPQDIKDPEVRKMHEFVIANHPTQYYPPRDSIAVWYLWSGDSPMKKYLFHLKGKSNKPYLHYWHLASVPLGKWADYLVKKYPAAFLQHYIKPNFLLLFNMPNEALFIFPQPSPYMKDWFACNNCAVAPKYNFYHDFLAATTSKSFNLLWLLFLLSLIALLFPSKLNCSRLQYQMLLAVSFFCFTYIAMSVYASPIVLRYLLVLRHSLIMIPFLISMYYFPARKR